jgi:hypothetical protein
LLIATTLSPGCINCWGGRSMQYGTTDNIAV